MPAKALRSQSAPGFQYQSSIGRSSQTLLEDVKEEEEITEEQFQNMSEFREFWEIEYTTGDIYRGELRGD